MNELTVWEQHTNTIKNMFAKDLNQDEFQAFLQLGKAIGANPFTREIYAQVYNSKDGRKVNMFCGRDFYRRIAQEQKEYNGHTKDVVCENDTFKVQNGVPFHEYSFKNRGKIIGAYCTVYKKNVSVPTFVFVDFSEYNTGRSVWIQKPKTMIVKVAEAQALREAFQGVFAGTYSEDENWIEQEPKKMPEKVIQEKSQTVEKEIPVESEKNEMAPIVERINYHIQEGFIEETYDDFESEINSMPDSPEKLKAIKTLKAYKRVTNE